MDYFFHNFLLKDDRYHPFASDTLNFELEFIPPVHHEMYKRLSRIRYSMPDEYDLYDY